MFYANLGKAYEATGEASRAAELYRQASDLDPDNEYIQMLLQAPRQP
jgi:cytochrome c-type biogenesis protein CcmH/NrfG